MRRASAALAGIAALSTAAGGGSTAGGAPAGAGAGDSAAGGARVESGVCAWSGEGAIPAARTTPAGITSPCACFIVKSLSAQREAPCELEPSTPVAERLPLLDDRRALAVRGVDRPAAVVHAESGRPAGGQRAPQRQAAFDHP